MPAFDQPASGTPPTRSKEHSQGQDCLDERRRSSSCRQPPGQPSDLEIMPDEPPDPRDLDDEEAPLIGSDDSLWEAFIADDDERDPEPAEGDFWIGDESDYEWPLEMQ